MVILHLWTTRRFLFEEYYWKSDENGLTARSILRKRFIPWSDVIKTSFNRDLQLITTTSKITIGPFKDYSGLYLACSIWQHLRRHWKADDSDLPEGADSLWDRIPATLPREMEWINSKRARIALNAFISIVVTVGFSVPFYYMPSSKGNDAFIMPVFMAIMIGLLCTSLLWNQIITARRLVLNGGNFEAVRAYNTIKVAFSDITRMVYLKPNLTISIHRKKIVLPFNSSDEYSQKMMLALIRALREHGHLIPTPIPDELRRPRKMPPIPGWESITLGLSKSECLLISGYFSFAGLGGLLKWFINPSDRVYWDVCITFGFFVLSILAYRTAKKYQISINSEKLRKSFLMWSKTIYWSDVAEYEIVAPRQGYSRQRLLKNSQGKILMDANISVGEWEERVRFFNYLDSILADKIKSYDDKRTWLAQPWEPES